MSPKISTAGVERLEIVDSAERLAVVGPAWTELWQRLDGLIFQSHAWISAWWQTSEDRDSRALRIGLVWQGDRLVAVMPLAISRRKGLRFLEWAAVAYSDYTDLLVAPECAPEAIDRLRMQVNARGGFDLAFINRLRPEAVALNLINRPISHGVSYQPHQRVEVSHRVTGPWETGLAWYNSLSKKMRKTYRHNCNTIEKSGGLTFRLLPLDEPLEPVLKRLAVLKSKWLADRGLESQLFDADADKLAAFVGVLAQAGILRLFVIENNGAIIAMSVNFEQHGTLMAWVTTFDPDFGAASPGQILMIDYIKWAFDNRLHTVDFLCGAEAFKERFATKSVTLTSMIGARTLRGSGGLMADWARRRIRKIRDDRAAARRPVIVVEKEEA